MLGSCALIFFGYLTFIIHLGAYAIIGDPVPAQGLVASDHHVKAVMEDSRVKVIGSLFTISDYLEEGDMLFFDVDGTILTKGSNMGVRGDSAKTKIMAEKTFPDFFYALNRLNIPSFVLTARNTSRKPSTDVLLKDLGLDFSTVQKRLGLDNLDEDYFFIKGQGFRNGVILANKGGDDRKVQYKGAMLHRFLEHIRARAPHHMPKRIIMVDNAFTAAYSILKTDLGPIDKLILILKRPKLGGM